MISLTRLVEQQGMEGQYYDLGKDFSNFKRTIDGASEQVKQKFEQSIGAKLNGKKIRARASKGYKQFVRDYEFDVSKVTLDDYYDNYVVVAHDNTRPKPKEYFLKPGFKIQIIGPASAYHEPAEPEEKPEAKESPEIKPVSKPVVPAQANAQQNSNQPEHSPSEPLKEDEEVKHDAYSIDLIVNDIKPWITGILKNTDTISRDVVKSLGWKKDIDAHTSIVMFDLTIPKELITIELTEDIIKRYLLDATTANSKFTLVKMIQNEDQTEWDVRIRKTIIK